MIESINNEKIKNYAKLNQKKYRDETGLFIVEGKHLVEEALKYNLVVDAFSLDGSVGTMVCTNVMKKLSSLDSFPNELAIVKKLEEREIKGNILILDDIQDPGNLGTIIRSAIAFNVDTIVSSLNTVDLYNIKTIRATEGMLFNINYLKRDIKEFIKSIKDDYIILNTNVNNGESIDSISLDKRFALIVGNEGAGVKEDIAKLADTNIYIPMDNKCESLNVGVATSILLYELYKK